MTIPVENKDDTKHFLPPEEARKHIDSTNPTLKDLTSVIPNAKATTVEKKIMEERKRKDKHNTFNATKAGLSGVENEGLVGGSSRHA